VKCPIWLFSRVTWCRVFSGMLLRYFLNYFDTAPVVPYFYWYHFCCYIPRAQYSTVRSSYFKNFRILSWSYFFLLKLQCLISDMFCWYYYYYYYYYYVITFMQGIDNYTPEANQISRMYNVAALLWLQFMIHAMLFPMISAYYYYYYYYYYHHHHHHHLLYAGYFYLYSWEKLCP